MIWPIVFLLGGSVSLIYWWGINIGLAGLARAEEAIKAKSGKPETPIQFEITWKPPAPIVYGTPLSSTQLNAEPSVSATPTYEPDIGYMLPVGQHQLKVTFAPADAKRLIGVALPHTPRPNHSADGNRAPRK